MSDISELEGRITAALERVSRGVEALAQVPEAPAVDGDLVARLKEELEAEKTANAQLEERVRAIRDRQDAQVDAVSARADQAEAEIARLHQVINNLRESNRALRDAHMDGMVEPSLINAALLAELEALRAQRDSDRAELDGIIADLEPLTGEQAHA